MRRVALVCDLGSISAAAAVLGYTQSAVSQQLAALLPRRDTPAGRFRSVVEYLCAQAGFEPRVAYDLDDLPAAQAFVAAGIAVVPMHGLMLGTLPPGATARHLAERPAGSRTVEALAPVAVRTPAVEDLLARLADAARPFATGPADPG